MKHNFQKNEMGFTLIETMVSLFIFAIVISIVSSVFISGLTIQRRASNIQQVQENSAYILEKITKEIRMGNIVATTDSGANCSNPSSSLTIILRNEGTIVYALNGNNLTRTVIETGTSAVINSNTIQFTNLKFCIYGKIAGDLKQPRVTIVAGIKSTNADALSVMNIQTTASQRQMDY